MTLSLPDGKTDRQKSGADHGGIKRGAVKIANKERAADWTAIHADYINGLSLGNLTKKYGVSKSTIYRHVKRKKWAEDKDKAEEKAREAAIEKTADAAADNAKMAAALKGEMLQRLALIAQKYPRDATEVRMQKGGATMIYKLTDLTRALRDLTDDMPKDANDVEDLDALAKLLKE